MTKQFMTTRYIPSLPAHAELYEITGGSTRMYNDVIQLEYRARDQVFDIYQPELLPRAARAPEIRAWHVPAWNQFFTREPRQPAKTARRRPKR